MYGHAPRLHRRLAGPTRAGVLFLAGLAVVAWPGSSAGAATLAELFNGGFLVANNARFDNWQLVSVDNTAAPTPDFALITVAPLVNDPANPGLSFAGNGQLAVAGLNALDLVLRFQVHALGAANSFTGQSLSLTSISFASENGAAYVSQETTTQTGQDLGAAVTFADNQSDVFQFSDDALIAPHLNLSVTTNVFLTGLVNADSINLATFTQRFAQTGPTALAGDFNNDKKVDGADFLQWQRGGSPTPGSAPDFAAWRSNFGVILAVSGVAGAVPEPSAALVLLTALGAAARWRR